ncbi:MAG TPA: hypothetical protein VIL72_00920 [Beijerinckiaceae bacterium]
MADGANLAGGSREPALAPVRACGTCMMCCKVLHVAELDKPAGPWCGHARPGKGCATYETRPVSCAEFWCDWRRDARLGPEWKPDRARFLLTHPGGGPNLVVAVDPAFPNAWLKEPYQSTIRRWAVEGAPRGRFVFVRVGRRCLSLLPDGDRDLGDIGPADDIRIMPAPGAGGLIWRVDVRRQQQSTAA